jgi:DNA-binding response OmpR family regulator
VDEATELDLGGRRLDVTGRRVVGGGQVVDLSGREAALLEVLARRPQQVFTRPQLLAAVFDPADDPGSVDTYVYYLRRKLGRDCVTTVHGVGYRLGTIS